MGIQDLSKFIKDNHSSVIEEVSLNMFAYKKVAVDISIYMCGFKAMNGDDWLFPFVKMISVLREHNIHPIIVYDTASPLEKMKEKEKRSDSREKTASRITALESAILSYETDGVIDPILTELQTKANVNGIVNLLGETKLNMTSIRNSVDKMKRQVFTVTKADFDKTRELFTILKVPWINAKMEAETLCAQLCINGLVDAVLSDDTDVLAYGAPVFISKIDYKTRTCRYIQYDKVLTDMGLTSEQFLEFCIMCGCDYNSRIPKVGPVNALKQIVKFGNIDEYAKETGVNVDCLNHVRVREMFRAKLDNPPTLPYSGIPDWNYLSAFFLVNNIRVNIEHIKKSFVRQIK
jgi:flap endonuclease-1